MTQSLLPPSFAAAGFRPTAEFKGLLIGTEGGANCGKTEFAWSAPGPAINLALDRGNKGVERNPDPPPTRVLWEGHNMVTQMIEAPLNTGVQKAEAQLSWGNFYTNHYKRALGVEGCRTVILDGDSDSFEWQMLAEFGRTNQIPQIQRTGLNAARRVMISRAADSGKVVIFTNKLKRKYENVWDAHGNPVPDPEKPGQQLRQWDGKSYERQGFNDHEYCYELQLRHLYERPRTIVVKGVPREVPGKWGVQILMCKASRKLEGDILWGEDCNLQSLLTYIYPHIPLTDWGYLPTDIPEHLRG